jgi:hypothetical protein
VPESSFCLKTGHFGPKEAFLRQTELKKEYRELKNQHTKLKKRHTKLKN